VSIAARDPLAQIPIAHWDGHALAAFGYVSGHYRNLCVVLISILPLQELLTTVTLSFLIAI
jgi:hypothetical protein